MYKAKYETQRYNARNRGVDWEFTYESWLAWWEATGKLDQRGVKAEQYCMCRIGDEGPYSPENVYCATNSENVKDGFKNGKYHVFSVFNNFQGKKHTEETKLKISENNASRLSEEEIASRIEVYNSLDMTKWGALTKFAKTINVSHTQARRFIKDMGL